MNTHTHIHTTRLLRFVSGVYVLKMWGGGRHQYEACLLTRQVGITLITSPPDFRFLRLHHMTGLSRHAATGRALPHGAIQNCPLRYRPSQKVETVCVRASVRVCVSCLKQWMAALSVGEQLCMLFVFTLGKCTLSPSSGEQREFAITAPHVYFCAHLSQSKAGDQIKLLTLEEFCQPHNAAAA